MGNQEYSVDLQKKSDEFFRNFRTQMQNDFGHIYKDLEFATFFEGVIRTVVTESMEIVFGTSKIDDEIKSRTLKIFGGVIERDLIPFFNEVKEIGMKGNISESELVNYSYNYVIRSTSNVLPADVLQHLNLDFSKDVKEISDNTSEKKLLNKWHLIDMINLAKSDGNFDDDEKEYLICKAQRLGVDIEDVRSEFESSEITEVKVPNESFRKIEYFVDLVLMMVADGEIHKHEEDFCIRMGKTYQFPTSKVLESIEIFQETLKAGRQPITAVPQVIKLLKERAF